MNEKQTNLMMHIFIQWLTNKNLLTIWMDAVLNQIVPLTPPEYLFENDTLFDGFTKALSIKCTHIQYDSLHYIDQSFIWMNTIEGYEFWHQIEHDWNESTQDAAAYQIGTQYN